MDRLIRTPYFYLSTQTNPITISSEETFPGLKILRKIYGGIPAQANMRKNENVFEKVFCQSPSTEPFPNPEDPSVPPWTHMCMAVNEVVKVDISISS